jgi:hypothetical protein
MNVLLVKSGVLRIRYARGRVRGTFLTLAFSAESRLFKRLRPILLKKIAPANYIQPVNHCPAARRSSKKRQDSTVFGISEGNVGLLIPSISDRPLHHASHGSPSAAASRQGRLATADPTDTAPNPPTQSGGGGPPEGGGGGGETTPNAISAKCRSRRSVLARALDACRMRRWRRGGPLRRPLRGAARRPMMDHLPAGGGGGHGRFLNEAVYLYQLCARGRA